MKAENKYQWKIPSFAKGIDPNKAIKEFKRIEKEYGSLTPENTFEASYPDKSLFHSLFEWDAQKCFYAHNLQLARVLINNIEVKIISDGESYEVPVYEIVKTKDEERKYKHIEALTFDEKEQVRKTTLETIKQLTNKVKIYKEWKKVTELFHEAVEILSK